jgi:hypothetical protein
MPDTRAYRFGVFYRTWIEDVDTNGSLFSVVNVGCTG